MSISDRQVRIAAFIVAGILLTVGLVLVGLYLFGIVEILVERPADRSFIFWGLSFAIFGALALVAGVALAVVASRIDRDS